MTLTRQDIQIDPLVRARRRTTALVCLLCAVLVSSCAAPKSEPLPVHFADGYRLQVLYLSANVAIARQLKVLADDTQAFFTLGRAQPGDAPESTETNDYFEERVKGTIKRVGRSRDDRWLVAESVDYDWEKHKSVAYATAIELSSGAIHTAATPEELGASLGDTNVVASATLAPVEYFFERELLSRLVEQHVEDVQKAP